MADKQNSPYVIDGTIELKESSENIVDVLAGSEDAQSSYIPEIGCTGVGAAACKDGCISGCKESSKTGSDCSQSCKESCKRSCKERKS